MYFMSFARFLKHTPKCTHLLRSLKDSSHCTREYYVAHDIHICSDLKSQHTIHSYKCIMYFVSFRVRVTFNFRVRIGDTVTMPQLKTFKELLVRQGLLPLKRQMLNK